MKNLKEMLPYLIVNAIAFYLIPIIIKDTGTAMGVMLIILPLICFITSLIYGIKHSFNIIYVIIVAILFAPTIFIFYNSTAAVYIIGYGIIALVGNLIGQLFHKPKLRKVVLISFIIICLCIVSLAVRYTVPNDLYIKMSEIHNNGSLVGLSQQEVVAMLGEPIYTDYESDKIYRFSAGEEVEKTIFGITSYGIYELRVFFDSEYKVKETKMRIRD